MTVACLAWGSLVWDPRGLPLDEGWHSDGPGVQVEFLRQSRDGRMTLVLEPSAITVQALWAKIRTDDLASAVAVLAEREGIGQKSTPKFIGTWSIGQPEPSLIHGLKNWAKANAIDHVIWTALPPKFNDDQLRASPEQVLTYLKSLTGNTRDLAEEYVRNAPLQIRTQFRQAIEDMLQWTPWQNQG